MANNSCLRFGSGVTLSAALALCCCRTVSLLTEIGTIIMVCAFDLSNCVPASPCSRSYHSSAAVAAKFNAPFRNCGVHRFGSADRERKHSECNHQNNRSDLFNFHVCTSFLATFVYELTFQLQRQIHRGLYSDHCSFARHDF